MIHTSCRSESSYLMLGRLDKVTMCQLATHPIWAKLLLKPTLLRYLKKNHWLYRTTECYGIIVYTSLS